jgi:hypothetical protein
MRLKLTHRDVGPHTPYHNVPSSPGPGSRKLYRKAKEETRRAKDAGGWRSSVCLVVKSVGEKLWGGRRRSWHLHRPYESMEVALWPRNQTRKALIP